MYKGAHSACIEKKEEEKIAMLGNKRVVGYHLIKPGL